MDNIKLYKKLKDAYSDNSLNEISAWIIDLYKNKQFLKIRKLSGFMSEYIDIDENEKMNRCFFKLISTFHPDKGNHYRTEIEKIYENGNMDELQKYAHILIFKNKEAINSIQEETIDIGFEYEYEFIWDYEAEGYQYFNDIEDEDFGSDSTYFYQQVFDGSFYAAVKRKIYGTLEVELPAYYLEDFEEIDMAQFEIEHLDGIEHCKHVTKLDLSGNHLTDIQEMCQLKNLEELYVSGNNINDISALCFLKRLRFLDVSYNDIDDVSPLFQLEGLQYINVVGNKIPDNQRMILEDKNILVVT
jgi:Leucine-rich repeat (LRR) protein